MRMRRVVSGMAVLAVFGLTTFAAAADKHGPPPQPLHQEPDGHWTPYTLPTEYPSGPDVTIYTIQPGDWLSKIAQKHLGDWRLWPQIWEKNLWIRDSHWIYPGDRIVIVGGTSSSSSTSTTSTATESTSSGDETTTTSSLDSSEDSTAATDLDTASLAGEPFIVATEDAIYCFGYVDDEDGADLRHEIIGSETFDDRISYATGDVLFIDGGAAADMKAGDRFMVVDDSIEIRDPESGRRLGKFRPYLGSIRIICVQDEAATVEVVASCDSIEIGMKIRPFEEIPVPIARRTPARTVCDASGRKLRGHVVFVRDDLASFAEDHIVLIDLGAEEGLKPGDLFTIYGIHDDHRNPRVPLGELAVLTTGEHLSSARVTASRQHLWIGLEIEAK